MTNAPQQPVAPQRSAAARPILIATAIIGGFALLVTGTSAAVAAIGAQAGSSGSVASATSLEATGITRVDVDASAADFTIEFGDVSEAKLAATGPRSDQWNLRRDGGDLVVDRPRGVFGFCFGWCPPAEQTVVLTLPQTLKGDRLGLDVHLGAGALSAEGDFGDVNLELSAGRMTVSGSARTMDLEMSAGNFTGDLRDVTEASFSVSAGSAEAELTGTAPRATDLEVSAGSLDLTLPDETYRVSTEVSAGNIDNQLRTDPNAENRIEAEISAGKIALRPGR